MFISAVLRNIRLLAIQTPIKYAPCINTFSSKAPPQGVIKRLDPDTGEIKTQKTNIIPKITLVTNDNVAVTTLQEAEKMSKRRDLKLVKINDLDAKTQRPVYRLMTGAEYHAEDLRQRERRRDEREQQHVKGEKVLLLNSRITPHDLETQLRKAMKWLKKMYEVRVIISGSGNVDASEKVYTSIQQYLKNEEADAKIVHKRTQGSDIKFQIIPPTYKDRNYDL